MFAEIQLDPYFCRTTGNKIYSFSINNGDSFSLDYSVIAASGYDVYSQKWATSLNFLLYVDGEEIIHETCEKVLLGRGISDIVYEKSGHLSLDNLSEGEHIIELTFSAVPDAYLYRNTSPGTCTISNVIITEAAEKYNTINVDIADKAATTQSAQFQLVEPAQVEFVDGNAVMTIGNSTTKVAQLPMANDGRMEISFCDYDAENNHMPAKVTSAGYGTLYSAFQLVVPDDVEVYSPIYDQINSVMRLNSSNRIPAGTILPVCTGVLLRNEGEYSFNYSIEEPTLELESILSGTSIKIPTKSVEGTVLTLGKGKNSGKYGFYPFTGAELSACRAFFVIDEPLEAMQIIFSFDDNTEGIPSDANITDDTTQAPLYNITGLRLSEHAVTNGYKGIVVTKGRKIIVK